MKNENPTVVFTEPGKVEIENRQKPAPEKGELLIQTKCSLISTGTEIGVLTGELTSAYSEWGQLPFVPGYSNVGEVVDIGAEVNQDLLGKRVATYGTHAQFISEKAESARLIQRDKIKNEQAAFFTIAEIVMNGVRRANVRWGESVVVYGLGLLGQLTVRFCRLCGARPVFAVDVADARLQRLPNDNGIICLNPEQKDVVSIIKETTKGRMADVVFEVTGNADLIPDEFKVLKQQGRFVVLSSPRGKTLFDFHALCNELSFTIIGTHNSSHPEQATPDNPWTKERNDEFFFDLIADEEVDVTSLISHRERYTKAPDLYQMLLKDRSQAMGVILNWS